MLRWLLQRFLSVVFIGIYYAFNKCKSTFSWTWTVVLNDTWEQSKDNSANHPHKSNLTLWFMPRNKKIKITRLVRLWNFQCLNKPTKPFCSLLFAYVCKSLASFVCICQIEIAIQYALIYLLNLALANQYWCQYFFRSKGKVPPTIFNCQRQQVD